MGDWRVARGRNPAKAPGRRRKSGLDSTRYLEGQISFRSPPVFIPAVGDADDQHDEYIFAHFVNHAVIAHAKPTEAPHIALERITEEWILCQAVDSCDNPRSVRLDDSLQFLGRGGLNPYREDHA